jgi:hypothetical protein
MRPAMWVELSNSRHINIDDYILDASDKIIIHIQLMFEMVDVQVLLEVFKTEGISVFEFAVIIQMLLKSIVGEMD